MQAIVARYGAVRGFCLDGAAIWGHEHRGHQAKRSKALRDRVRLHIAVVVFTGPDKAATPFKRGGNHIVNQAMLVVDAFFRKPRQIRSQRHAGRYP